MDGSNALAIEALIRLGFNDVILALLNTIEALEKITTKGNRKKEMNKIIGEVVAKGNKDTKSIEYTKDDFKKIVKEAVE